MKHKLFKYLLMIGFSLGIPSFALSQSSTSQSIKIDILRPNKMTIEKNNSEKNLYRDNTCTLKLRSHNKEQKITVFQKNWYPENKVKMIIQNILTEKTNAEIPITNVPTNLINGKASDNDNCQFQFVVTTDKQNHLNNIKPTVIYTLTDT